MGSEETRCCKTCGQTKPIDQYPLHNKSVSERGRRIHCRECLAVYHRERAYARKWQLKLYGLTFEDFAKMLAAQGGTCAICKKGSDTNLCVDHNHTTGEVRGLLCHACNKALGGFGDSPRTIASALQYLITKGHA